MKRVLLLGTAVAVVSATPAFADDNRKVSIDPYIEIGQVVDADLTNNDVLTYSTVAAGIDASVQTHRAEAQISARYERRIAYQKDIGDSDVISGLARGSVKIVPGLSMDAGVLATRARSDIRGSAPVNLAGNVDNISQVYSAYVGPTVSTHAGPVQIGGAYRFGYTKVESPTTTGIPAGDTPLDTFDSATSHVAMASASVKPGSVLPVGVAVSGIYERDNANQLDQRFEDKMARGDVTLPVSATLALRAGAGYEKITVSQKDALVDGAGQPVLDSHGRYQTAPGSAQKIAYETDGLIYDAGVIWRPSARTELQANVGWRYGGMTYTGSLTWAASRSVAVQVGVYDDVTTFGRQLRDGIAKLPTSFIDQRDAFSDQFSGCTFGNGKAGAGGCLNGVFQSISTSAYRARGVDAVLSANRGPLSFGAGVGYANRHFETPTGGPLDVDGLEDNSYYVQAFVNASLDSRSSISGDVIANYYKSGLAGTRGIFSTGATASYNRSFGRLSATASAGIYSFSQQGTRDQVSAQGQVGARYTF